MRIKTYRILSILGIVLFIFSGLAVAASFPVEKTVADLKITADFEKGTPFKGKNRLKIAITDAAGKPVVDAKIKVEYGMQPMNNMPPMKYRTKARVKDDKYSSMINFAMPGHWFVKVNIMRSGKVLDPIEFKVMIPKS